MPDSLTPAERRARLAKFEAVLRESGGSLNAAFTQAYCRDEDSYFKSIENLCADLRSLLADVEGLRKALKPFALDPMRDQGSVEVICRDGIRRSIRDHHFRAAHTAYQGTEKTDAE